MSDDPLRNPNGEMSRTDAEASSWLLRCDRGLTPEEQDELADWMAADPRNGQALARYRNHWARLDNLARWIPEHSDYPNPDLLAPPLRRRLGPWLKWGSGLAAAAALAFAFYLGNGGWQPGVTASADSSESIAATGPRILPDGTVVELNRGAELSVDFRPDLRRVILVSGEAHFSVTKDPSRPFVVNAKGIDVQAVGTAFNVRVDADAVEVLVTEGKVQLASALPSLPVSPLVSATTGAVTVEAPPVRAVATPLIPVLEARQRAVVSLTVTTESPQVATLTAGEIERVLSWQHRLLDFDAAPLTEIVAEFNRRNVIQLVIVDADLAATRISASLRSDNIDGFLHLLRAGFSVRTERRGESEVLLRAAP